MKKKTHIDMDFGVDPFGMFENENEDIQVVKELFTDKNIDMKTDLDDGEITNVALLYFLADEFKIPALQRYADKFLRLRVSKQRKGRAEFIQAVKREEPSDVKGLSRLMKSGKI